MQAVVPVPPATAPSSPKPFGRDPSSGHYFYASAPASPTRAAAIYQEFAFGWEEQQEGSSQAGFFVDDGFDFSLGFSGQLEGEGPAAALATADELFEEGMIRPLNSSRPSSTTTPLSPKSRGEVKRGRGRSSTSSNISTSAAAAAASSRSRRGTRSLSPNLRGEDGPIRRSHNPHSSTSSCSSANVSSSLAKSGGSKKWSFKDLFLFRSASEGRATGRGSKDFLYKYTLMLSSSSPSASPSSSSSSFSSFLPSIFGKKRTRRVESPKNAASSTPGSKNGSTSARRGGGGRMASPPPSAHEMHYTANKVVSEEMRKKTPLPYQSNSMFDCLRFNPAIQGISRELGGSSSSYRR